MLSFIRKKIEARLFGGDVKRMIGKGRIPDARASLERLKKLGFDPAVVFDVGAYNGDFTQLCFDLWPAANVVAFEALPQKISMLQNRFNRQCVDIVEGIVGDDCREDVEYFADETASSVLASQELSPKKRLNQKMFTLDQFVRQRNTRPPDLLKIDTQGYEYPVLQGFTDHLGLVKAVLLELNFIEVYEGVKLGHEVIRLLADHGFIVYDICEIHRRPLDQALFQIDFIFVKQESPLRRDKRWDVG